MLCEGPHPFVFMEDVGDDVPDFLRAAARTNLRVTPASQTLSRREPCGSKGLSDEV